ncbi:hypothetical protein DSM44344_02579 [Mycobacterium marinum]|nr:hypothetical protein DSM44344_02579 [Mycobacterium marinum]
MIPRHRRHISGPHLFVHTLRRRNRRRILTKQIRHHQLHKPIAISRHRQRMHHRRTRRLKRRGHHLRRRRRPRGPRRRRPQPTRIRPRRSHHRRSRRTLPRLTRTRKTRGHRRKRLRRRRQLRRQPIPGRRRRQHRLRPRTREHPHRINLRRQHREIHQNRPSFNGIFSTAHPSVTATDTHRHPPATPRNSSESPLLQRDILNRTPERYRDRHAPAPTGHQPGRGSGHDPGATAGPTCHRGAMADRTLNRVPRLPPRVRRQAHQTGDSAERPDV